MTFTLLSDFDGVWTDQHEEALVVRDHLVARAAELAEVPRDRADAEFLAFEQFVRATPSEYGWRNEGRLSAYVDEDPFMITNALATFLEQHPEDPRTAPYREAIAGAGYTQMVEFADTCFREGMKHFRDSHPPALVPETAEVMQALHDRGVQVVIVSNSPASKIVGWFQGVGIDAGETGDHTVLVRGEAGKWRINSDQQHGFGERSVYVDRAQYRDVIRSVNPDVVIGDVFSLDLATPHAMRRAGMSEAPSSILLRRHSHTPQWILDLEPLGAIDRVVEGVSELLTLTEEMTS